MQESQPLLQDEKQEITPNRLGKITKNSMDEITKYLPTEDVISLKRSSKHFYGKHPTVCCPYTFKYSTGAGLYVCDSVFDCIVENSGRENEAQVICGLCAP